MQSLWGNRAAAAKHEMHGAVSPRVVAIRASAWLTVRPDTFGSNVVAAAILNGPSIRGRALCRGQTLVLALTEDARPHTVSTLRVARDSPNPRESVTTAAASATGRSPSLLPLASGDVRRIGRASGVSRATCTQDGEDLRPRA